MKVEKPSMYPVTTTRYRPAGAETRHHVRQRHVDDARIERRHERTHQTTRGRASDTRRWPTRRSPLPLDSSNSDPDLDGLARAQGVDRGLGRWRCGWECAERLWCSCPRRCRRNQGEGRSRRLGDHVYPAGELSTLVDRHLAVCPSRSSPEAVSSTLAAIHACARSTTVTAPCAGEGSRLDRPSRARPHRRRCFSGSCVRARPRPDRIGARLRGCPALPRPGARGTPRDQRRRRHRAGWPLRLARRFRNRNVLGRLPCSSKASTRSWMRALRAEASPVRAVRGLPCDGALARQAFRRSRSRRACAASVSAAAASARALSISSVRAPRVVRSLEACAECTLARALARNLRHAALDAKLCLGFADASVRERDQRTGLRPGRVPPRRRGRPASRRLHRCPSRTRTRSTRHPNPGAR